jgi:hypothetical protein
MQKILVAEPQIGGGYNAVSAGESGLDGHDLRAWLLLHDQIGYTFNPERPIWPGADAEYLESIGLFIRVMYAWHDNFPSYLAVMKGHMEAYRDLIIRHSHPAMTTRYGAGLACSAAHVSRSVRVSSW